MEDKELLGMLAVIAVFLLFFVAGLVIFIGALKKWRALMEPMPSAPPFYNVAAVIKNHFGARGLRAFWLILSVLWMSGSIAAITVAIKNVCRDL